MRIDSQCNKETIIFWNELLNQEETINYYKEKFNSDKTATINSLAEELKKDTRSTISRANIPYAALLLNAINNVEFELIIGSICKQRKENKCLIEKKYY